MAYKDYYKILGVSRSASPQEVKQAFKKLARQHHPDKNPGDKAAEERFKDINEAYTVLSDPEKREYYDRFGSQTPSGGGFRGTPPQGSGDFSDFFQQLFGGRGPFSDLFGQPQRGARGADLQVDLPLDLEQAFTGGERTVQIDGERLSVTIPAGVREGNKVRLRGRGRAGGDLYLLIKIKPSRFRLEGDDLWAVVEVQAPIAVVGGTARLQTLEGPLDLTIPKGSQSGRKFRLAGKGWPRKEGGRGDLYAELRLTIPTHPTPEEERLYQQLAQLGVNP